MNLFIQHFIIRLAIFFFIAIIVVVIINKLYDFCYYTKETIIKKFLIKTINPDMTLKEKVISEVVLFMYIKMINFIEILSKVNYLVKTNFIKYIFVMNFLWSIWGIAIENVEKIIDFITFLKWQDIIGEFKILIVPISILVIRNIYLNKLRQGVKEECYKEIVKEYFKVKDNICSKMAINIVNEEILYRILKFDEEELIEVDSMISKIRRINYTSSEYIEIINDTYKFISSRIYNFKDLEEYPQLDKKIESFYNLYNTGSRDVMLFSINKKLSFYLSVFSRDCRRLYEIDKNIIVERFITHNQSIIVLINDMIVQSIATRYYMYNLINKIDKEIGIRKKEHSYTDIIDRVK